MVDLPKRPIDTETATTKDTADHPPPPPREPCNSSGALSPAPRPSPQRGRYSLNHGPCSRNPSSTAQFQSPLPAITNRGSSSPPGKTTHPSASQPNIWRESDRMGVLYESNMRRASSMIIHLTSRKPRWSAVLVITFKDPMRQFIDDPRVMTTENVDVLYDSTAGPPRVKPRGVEGVEAMRQGRGPPLLDRRLHHALRRRRGTRCNIRGPMR